jgi:hypothetical protein
MKCINCKTDNNLKDRQANQGSCKSCYQAFVFEPTAMTALGFNFTDSLFANVLATISVNGTLFFTPKQFAYLLDRKLKYKVNSVIGSVGGYLFFSIIVGMISTFFGEFRWVVLGLFNMLCAFSLRENSNSPTSRPSYRRAATVLIYILGIVTLLGGISLGVVYKSWISVGVAILNGLPIIRWGFLQQRKNPEIHEESLVEPSQVMAWLKRWQSVHGNVDRLLPAPQASLAAAPDPAVTVYSFDRLVVCNQPAIAQILLENHFHFEYNCAILSITGYPENVCDTVLEMVRRNPDLMVYALHDASPDGVNLIHRLRSEDRWFPDTTVKIIDVGLLPRQAIAARYKMFIGQTATAASAAHNLPSATRQSLTATELAWLDTGNYVELESFTPQQLIQTLQRSIMMSRSSDFDSDSNITIWSDDGVSLIDSFDGGGFG